MGAKTNAPKRATAPARVTLASLAARIDALETEVANLRAQADLFRPKRLDAAAIAALGVAVLASVSELDTRQRLGGLVPIPELRRELRAREVEASDAAVSDALLALERDFKIDLSVAQSPTTVADRGMGIERPGRGLLYYVTRR